MLVAPNHWSPTKIPSLFYVYVPFFFHLLIVLCRLFFPCYKKTTVLDRIIPFSVFYQLPSGLEQRSSTYFSSISPQLMSPRRHYVAQSKGPRPITAVSDLELYITPSRGTKQKGPQPKTTPSDLDRIIPNQTRYGLQKITVSFLKRNK